jgi:outer membrane autotransporter protein
MMRASEVRGLTAAQIRDKFALPALPTNIVQVIVPETYALYTGIAAPIAGWGDGGGLQNRVMANKPPAGIASDPWLPGSSYVNAQALANAPVLSFNAAAPGSKNASRMGAYMDSLAPHAYSDLDGIYNALDTQLMSGQSASVAQAMSQFSPARFDALNTVSQRTNALQSASFDARAATLALGLEPGGTDGAGSGQDILLAFSGGLDELASVLPRLGQRQAKAGDVGLWLRGTGEYMCDNARGAMPFTAVTAALHAGADRRVGPELVFGLGAGYARTLLDWEQDGGDSVTSTFSLSVYAFWNSGEYFVNSDITMDTAFTEARRHILTAVTDRVARSSQSGDGANLRLRAGRRVALDPDGWTLIPAIELGYGLHRQNAFSEDGAGDLNLDVRAATAQTLRTGAELAVSKRVELAGDAVLIPEAAFGLQRETALDSRVMRAAFSGYSESFQSYGADTPRDSLLLRAGLTHQDADGLTQFARYSGTLRERFQAHSLEIGCRWSF